MLAAFLTWKFGELTGNYGPNDYICQLVTLDTNPDHNLNGDPDMSTLTDILSGADEPLTPMFLRDKRKELGVDPLDPNNQLEDQKKSISSFRCVPFCRNTPSNTLMVSENIDFVQTLLQETTWFNAYENPKAQIEKDHEFDTNFQSEYMDPGNAHNCGAPESKSIELAYKVKKKEGINRYEAGDGSTPWTDCDPTADPDKPCIIGVSNRWPWSETYTSQFGIPELPGGKFTAYANDDSESDVLAATSDDETEFAYSPLSNNDRNELVNRSGMLATYLPTVLHQSYKKALNGRNKNTFWDSESNVNQLNDVGHLHTRNLEQGHIFGCMLYPNSLQEKTLPQWGTDCYYGKNMEQPPPIPTRAPTSTPAPSQEPPPPEPSTAAPTSTPVPETSPSVSPPPEPPPPGDIICDPSTTDQYNVEQCVIDAIAAIESGGGQITGNDEGCPYQCCNYNATTGLCGCGPMQMDTRQIGAVGMTGQNICDLQTSCVAISRFALGMKAKDQFGWPGAHYEPGLENRTSVTQGDIDTIIGQWYGVNPSRETQTRWGAGWTYAMAVHYYCENGSLPPPPPQ